MRGRRAGPEDDITILTRTPLFSLMERDALRLIAFAAESRALRAGAVLFRRGERSDGGYVVTRGAVLVESEEAPPHRAGPGTLLGQAALFVRLERPATATAAEPSVVMRVSPTLMKRVLEDFPAAAAAIQQALSLDLSTLSGGLERVRRMLLAIDAKTGG